MEGENKSGGGSALYWSLGIVAFVLLAGFGMWWYKRSKTPSIMQPNNSGSSSDPNAMAALLSKIGGGGGRNGGSSAFDEIGKALGGNMGFMLNLSDLFKNMKDRKTGAEPTPNGVSNYTDGSYITDGIYYDANGYPQGTVDGSGNIINSSGTIIGNEAAGSDGNPSTDSNGQYAGPGPWDNNGSDGSSQTYTGPYNYDNNGGFGSGDTYGQGPIAPSAEYGPGF